MKRLRAKLTYANVVSTLCLFLLLGGTAFAASHLPKNSVGAKQIRRGAITPAKLATATKKAFAAVTGPVGPRGPVGPPGAAGPQGAPGAAGATHVAVRIGKEEKGSEVFCNPGEVAIGGGGIAGGAGETWIYGSLPVNSKHETSGAGEAPAGWFAGAENKIEGEAKSIAYVVCAMP